MDNLVAQKRVRTRICDHAVVQCHLLLSGRNKASGLSSAVPEDKHHHAAVRKVVDEAFEVDTQSIRLFACSNVLGPPREHPPTTPKHGPILFCHCGKLLIDESDGCSYGRRCSKFVTGATTPSCLSIFGIVCRWRSRAVPSASRLAASARVDHVGASFLRG